MLGTGAGLCTRGSETPSSGCGDSVVMRQQEERVGADAGAFRILLAAHGMKTSASRKCNPRVLAQRERPGWGRGGAEEEKGEEHGIGSRAESKG